MTDEPLRLLILGAHPDDAEYHAGGLASIYRQRGHEVKMVSLTDGRAGHYRRPPEALAEIRREEAAAAGAVIGAAYETWDIPDGELMPSVEVRRRVVREIRTFRPDLVLTHRPYDYHPDHRAAGQLVQDATYLVTVPNYLPEVPALFRDPVVAYVADLFTKPRAMAADVVLDVTDRLDVIVAMLACQRSQVFEWLPYQEGILESVPQHEGEKLVWLGGWYRRHMLPRAEHFREDLIAAYGEDRGRRIELVEVFELSDYAAAADLARRRQLFPGAFCRPPGSTAAATPSQVRSSEKT
ncbi:MAG TPA: PIG-L deacetylase family protein [Thermoguttaceae bacterium]|nr:PIG-L deacetylase family protein [Thermoguttaceae bacterium]HUT90979.1 PIG-L deacetylase family protein [Thermoguttaceae bacterium]